MALPQAVSDILRSFAPTLLTSLTVPPPFNALAAAVVSTALDSLARPGTATSGTRPGDTARGSPAVPAATPTPLSPDDVVRTVEINATNPALVPALRQAEIDLQKYEQEMGFRFAELNMQDRKRAGDFQLASGLSEKIFSRGIWLVYIALVSMLLMIGGLIYLGFASVPPKNPGLITAIFGIIGAVVGFINGLATTVVAYYWGSSQGSSDKTATIGDLSKELGRAASKLETLSTDQKPAADPTGPSSPTSGPAADGSQATGAQTGQSGLPQPPPLQPNVMREIVQDLSQPHIHFPTGVKWALTRDGVAIDGAAASGTAGEPATVRRIWKDYGTLCAATARRRGVPIELIVATIATETSGKPDEVRFEPKLNDSSVGLMQTLVKSAREALDRPSLAADDLKDPATSIEAGTAFIARQRATTRLDPPLVAAAYNAGSLRQDSVEANRWKLVCTPPGTGAHIDRFVAWFNDAMRVSAADKWATDPAVPSFAAAFSAPSASVSNAAPVGTSTAASAPTGKMLQAFNEAAVPVSSFAGREALATEIQQRLSDLGYLDPPPDGKFGPVSSWALEAFCDRNKLDLTAGFSGAVAGALLNPSVQLPAIPKAGGWIDRVVAFMSSRNYWMCRYPGCFNIVYLEGVNPDGTLNNDASNVFNDLRLVFWIDPASASLMQQCWQATTEPGTAFTENPLSPLGAARIAFDQYKAWVVGKHRASSPTGHEGLLQVEKVSVYRDLNKDYSRKGDKLDAGLFGINHHAGYDAAENDIGRASAGCLVGRTMAGHREFMDLIKTDPRYIASPAYRFMTAILPGDEVFK